MSAKAYLPDDWRCQCEALEKENYHLKQQLEAARDAMQEITTIRKNTSIGSVATRMNLMSERALSCMTSLKQAV
jgi:hypothetical protein